MLNEAKYLIVPVAWNKNEMSLVDLDTTAFKQTTKKPEFLSTLKIPNFWELFLHLSAREIPKKTVVQVKTDTIPLLNILTIHHTFWVSYRMI